MTVVEPVKEKRLTIDGPTNVKYCCEIWVRDEQIRINTQKVKGRLQDSNEMRSEPIALVSYGPSLNDTWEKIKDFKVIMTCSGAHKFLVDRGIIPTYHIDVDPRPHKIKLIGTPQKETQYLIASTCSPKLVDFLQDAGCDVKLWHIFDTGEDGMRLLPHGEWALTGGCSVGVRTLTMARFLGFTELHVFGMDGCSGRTGKHAAEHPNQPKGSSSLDYDGVSYQTTPSMLEAARNTWHELDMMKDVRATFHGEGLVQHMARNYQRKEVKKPVFIGFNKPELISAEYCDLNKKLHDDDICYGVGGRRHAETVIKIAESLTKHVKIPSVLDYGCGKGLLAKALPFPIAEYDPAIHGKTESPRPADLVCCLDVLEHVEEDRLHLVLDDLRRCVKRVGYFVIHTGPSTKLLADGRNSHILQKNPNWWKNRLSEFFQIPDAGVIVHLPVVIFVVGPKK